MPTHTIIITLPSTEEGTTHLEVSGLERVNDYSKQLAFHMLSRLMSDGRTLVNIHLIHNSSVVVPKHISSALMTPEDAELQVKNAIDSLCGRLGSPAREAADGESPAQFRPAD